MRVLFTNVALEHRAGTELYTFDLARQLQARGHEVVAYSPRCGAMAEALRAAGVDVTDDLTTLAQRGLVPDVIHAQHHYPALVALLAFPAVPAIFVCHGAVPWEEEPLRFPRIRCYVAVDEATHERLLAAGVAPESIEVFLSTVDLDRFAPRPPLPARPTRALVFSNQAHEDGYLPAVRAACRARGLTLDVVGRGVGREAATPETLLPAYDLVFAKGRAALEAMAVGAAVVLCDSTGAGPLVTAGSFDTLRRKNFGYRTLTRPLEATELGREIDRYDATDAARVSTRVRAEAGLAPTAERYLELYGRVITEHAAMPGEPAAESRAAARHLQWLAGELVRREREALERVTGTATWRLRDRLVRRAWLRRLWRWGKRWRAGG